jgi:hypothetical protein
MAAAPEARHTFKINHKCRANHGPVHSKLANSLGLCGLGATANTEKHEKTAVQTNVSRHCCTAAA